MAACVGALRGKRVRSVTIIGSSGVGSIGSAVNLEKVRHLEGQERRDTHRTNLSRLMIADPAKIDDLALTDPGLEHGAIAPEHAGDLAQWRHHEGDRPVAVRR